MIACGDRLISDEFERLLNSGVIEALAFKGFIAEVKRFLKDHLKLKQQITDGELTHALRHSTDEELKAALASVLNWLEENRQKDRDYADYLAYLEERRPSRPGGAECEDKDLPL